MTIKTTYMGIELPEVGVTYSPQWASMINAAFIKLDAHDHSFSEGNKITPSGMVIDQNFDMNTYGIDGANYVQVVSGNDSQDKPANTVYGINGDLYFTDGAGNEVRITASGALSTGALGTITGMTGQASVVYLEGSDTYVFTGSTGEPAGARFGDIVVDSITAESIEGPINGAPNSTGHGIVPIGAIVAINPNLTGAYSTSSIAQADTNGWVLCRGQTIVDVTSPMNGETIPNLSDDRFIMGAETAGATGGENLKVLVTANLPAHTHGMAHDHDMQHDHYSVYNGATDDFWTSTTRNNPTVATGVLDGDSNYTLKKANSYSSSYTSNSWLGGTSDASRSRTGGSSTSNTGSTGSGTGFDNRPKYLSVVYIMRIR